MNGEQRINVPPSLSLQSINKKQIHLDADMPKFIVWFSEFSVCRKAVGCRVLQAPCPAPPRTPTGHVAGAAPSGLTCPVPRPVSVQDVKYPEYLDIRPYMSQPNGEPIIYVLYAVLVHTGFNCHAGHYFCYIKVSWVGCARVSRCSVL